MVDQGSLDRLARTDAINKEILKVIHFEMNNFRAHSIRYINILFWYILRLMVYRLYGKRKTGEDQISSDLNLNFLKLHKSDVDVSINIHVICILHYSPHIR